MSSEKKDYESQLPTWQRWCNGFLENWIFAFIVAMVIRQFFLEPFVIPTASMEPMLLGSMRTSEADHVVVNKLTHRFTDAERWHVTVFEFPIPEVRQSGQERQLWGLGDEPDANWLSNPLQHRNFVKRLVVLPGDEFFVHAGDIYIKGDNGFQVARKPADIQEVLWQTMYEHGIDEGYKPWSTGSAIKDGKLLIKTGTRPVLFEQPLTNLYMKKGLYRVHPENDLSQSLKLELSMLEPTFNFKGKKGNAWDLKRWRIYRLKSKELDSQEHGSMLNRNMMEQVGDLRIKFNAAEIKGTPSLDLTDRDGLKYRLALTPDSWTLSQANKDAEDKILHKAEASLTGKSCALVFLDNQLWFEIDGVVQHEVVNCAMPKNAHAACAIAWGGQGQVILDSCAVERDVHYSRTGFLAHLLADQRKNESWHKRVNTVYERQKDRLEENDRKALESMLKEAQQRAFSGTSSVQRMIRERMLGRAPTEREAIEPIANSPKNAIKVPDEAYLLFGDNSPFSWDSRNWGWVPEGNIRGRAAWVVFPFSRWKSIR